ncbi:MAG: CDP-alcohol phosphatidyltransferase family protein [bacterium]|nr:CDP-alcohol phosphatidyltransferase family protein [bacterium]
MVGYWGYTVYLTYLSLISAVLGVGFAVVDHNAFAGAVCLLVSGFLDLFDGKVARTKKNRTDREKKFGMQIDSLADLVAFGVLPAAIGFAIGVNHWWQWLILALFVLCGLVRLAYFNVLEDERQATEGGANTGFIGLPITTSALIFPLIVIFAEDFGEWFQLVYLICLSIVGLLFVIRIKIKKPKLPMVIAMVIFGAIVLTILILRKCNVF